MGSSPGSAYPNPWSKQLRIDTQLRGHEITVSTSDSMHPFSVLTIGIFVAGYITARWDLISRLYELVVFAWDYGVAVRSVQFPFQGFTGRALHAYLQ